MKLSEKFEEALIYATRAHGNQMRKKTGIPYIAHILGVTAIALEYSANETEAIAALLHDTVEDCGGAERLRDIRERFGNDVARIVDGCTDTYETPKPPWGVRIVRPAIVDGAQRRCPQQVGGRRRPLQFRKTAAKGFIIAAVSDSGYSARGRLSSIWLINSGILIGLARERCPSMRRPVFASGIVTSAVRKIIGVLRNSRSASICAATSAPSVSGIMMSSRIASGRKLRAL